MNIIEYNLLCLTILTTFAYLFYISTGKDLKFSIIIVILITPLLYFSIIQSTSFLTVDETYMILESIELKTSDMTQWNHMGIWKLGGLRTTDLVIGSVFSLLSLVVDFQKQSHIAKLLGKALHWYFGFLLLLNIHYVFAKNYLNRENSKINIILTLSLLILLPAINFSLRIFNYDLFSMLLSGIAILFLIKAFEKKSTISAFYATIYSFFAAQEKITASPVLFLSIVLFTYYTYRNSKYYVKDRFFNRIIPLCGFTTISISLPLLLSFINYITVGMLRKGSIPNLAGLADPLIGWSFPLIKGYYVGYDFGIRESGVGVGIKLIKLKMSFVIISGMFIGVIVVNELLRLIERIKRDIQYIIKIKNKLTLNKDNILLIVFFVILIFGVAGLYAPNYLVGPVLRVPEGNFQPSSFNDWYMHFGSRNALSHTLRYTLHSYGEFFNGLPTALLIILIFSLVVKKRENSNSWFMLFIFTLMLPLAFGFTLMPVNIRYINSAILLFLMYVMYIFDKIEIGKNIKVLLAIATIILIFCEVYPFRPMYCAFRPIWVKYPNSFNNLPEVGKMRTGAWPGWGEELMIAGKKIEKQCIDNKMDCKDVRLYYSYPGEWNDAKLPIQILYMQQNIPHLRFTKKDFYVINRAAIVWGYIRDINIDEVKLESKINYRGYTEAWIIRGDNLVEQSNNLDIVLNKKDLKVEIRDKKRNRIYFSIPYVY